MRDRSAVAETVLAAIEEVCHGRVTMPKPRDDVSFEADLELDSIEIVEVLLKCEERYGIGLAPLLDVDPLTFGRVVDHFVGP